MGKKKRVKKKLEEVSEGTTSSQATQPPRKRGRPRKIVQKTESEERSQAEDVVEEVAVESKKVKTGEEQTKIGSTSSSKGEGEGEEEEEEEEEKPKEIAARSRGRRKSQPRKSC